MLLVRSLRPDRVSFVSTNFIVNNLSSRFVEPPPLDMNAVLSDSTATTPLIFVLSTGVDPTKSLLDLAEKQGMGKKFHSLSLGQGQAPIAERLIAEGVKHGFWIFLANCHLSLSWMPALSKIVEMFETNRAAPRLPPVAQLQSRSALPHLDPAGRSQDDHRAAQGPQG